MGASKTEDWLTFGCPLLVDGSVCVGGGPLIKLFVMGCLWCVAERGCGACGCCVDGQSLLVWVFAGFGGTSSWVDALMFVSRRPVKEELFILR